MTCFKGVTFCAENCTKSRNKSKSSQYTHRLANWIECFSQFGRKGTSTFKNEPIQATFSFVFLVNVVRLLSLVSDLKEYHYFRNIITSNNVCRWVELCMSGVMSVDCASSSRLLTGFLVRVIVR